MRRDNRQCTESSGCFVTDEGHADLVGAETCRCSDMGYERNMLVCRDCGTVYGVAQFKAFKSGWSRLSWAVDFGHVE